MQGDFSEGLRHGEGQLQCGASGTRYSGRFAHGEPWPAPGTLSLRYPQTFDKKKGPLPPELRRGTLCSLPITLTVQAAETDRPGAASECTPEADGGDSEGIAVCTNESLRPITLHVRQGWPDAPAGLGSRLDRPCLEVTTEPAAADPTPAPDVAHTSETGTAAGQPGDAPETAPGEQAPRGEEAPPIVHTLDGVCKIGELRFGALHGEAELSAGQYTLVFSSHGLEDACMPFVAT